MQILQSTANWRLPVLIALLLTPVALVTHGYYFAKQDQRLHIPFIYRTIDPALYPNDYLFDQRQANISLSEYVFVWPVGWLGIEWTMFLAYILAQMAILLGIYILARHLVSPISAYLAMLFFLIPMQVGGTEIRTYENYFNPRTLVLPLTLLILTMLWKQNVWIAAILVCLQLLFHPISGLPIWIVMMLFLLSWFWQGFLPKRSLIMATGLLIFTLGLMIWRSSGENQLWLDPTWRDILEERTPFLFLSNWRTHQWLSLVTFFLLGIVGWSGRPRDIKTTELSIFVLVVVLGLTVAVILGVDWFGFAPLLQLQLGRSWQLVVILAIIFGSDLIYILYQAREWPYLLIATLLSIAIFFDQGNGTWWFPIQILLGAILIDRIVKTHMSVQGRVWANSIMVLSSLIVVIPPALSAFLPQKNQLLTMNSLGWQLSPSEIGFTFLIFGILLIITSAQQQNGVKRRWSQIGIGGFSILISLFIAAQIWSPGRWAKEVAPHLQVPFTDIWVTPELRSWQEVQRWAAANTPIDARFATGLKNEGFRVYSKRSPITEDKDGAPTLYTRAYALEWNHRMLAIKSTEICLNEEQNIDCFESLYESYPFDYVVIPLQEARLLQLDLPEAYINEDFIVYVWSQQDQ